jgi:hypothetical protein
VRDELEQEPEEVHARFDPRAFVAVSLCRVHRATLEVGPGRRRRDSVPRDQPVGPFRLP